METTVFRWCSLRCPLPKTSHMLHILSIIILSYLHITETSWNFNPSDLKHLWFFLVSEASAVEQLQHCCSGHALGESDCPCADVSDHPGDFFDERAQQGLATWLSCSVTSVGGGLAFSNQHVAYQCSKCVWPKPRTHPKDQSHSENFLEAPSRDILPEASETLLHLDCTKQI